MISLNRTVMLTSFALVLFLFGIPASASAATYNLTADKDTFVIGDTFHVDVKIDSTDVGINAAQATITFPKDIVQVTSIDKTSSAFDFWLQGPSFSNDTGQVSFIGGSQSGLSGKSLEIARITFTVKGAGAVGIIFSDGAVTASDGSGTNVLTAMNGLQLTSITKQSATLIKPPQIIRPAVVVNVLPIQPVVTVPLYPDPSGWYSDTSKFIAQWDLPREVTDVATVVDRQPDFAPTVSEGLFNNKTFGALSDGIWYLHVRFKNSAGWGPTRNYRIGIDTAPPLSFAITSPSGLSTSNVAPTIHFETKDQPSGISGYKILVNNVVATTTILTSYTLLPQPVGKQLVVVQAVDKAGNITESRITFDILGAPFITIAGVHITQFWFFVTIIIAIIGGGLFGWNVGRKAKEQRLRRLIVAERDVQIVFGIIEKDLRKLLVRMNDVAPATVQTENEIRIVLTRTLDTITKNMKYVVQNIQEIES